MTIVRFRTVRRASANSRNPFRTTVRESQERCRCSLYQYPTGLRAASQPAYGTVGALVK
jgi:hypothetical protein